MKCPFCKSEMTKLPEKVNISDRFLYNIYVARRRRGEPAKAIINDLLSKIRISRATLFRKLRRIRDILRRKIK